MSDVSLLDRLKQLVVDVESDYVDGMAGIKSAARRARKRLQELGQLRVEMRKSLQPVVAVKKKEAS